MDPGLELCAPVAAWFQRRFGAPTEPQRRGWPAIARGEDTLIAAPTGSGKTLAAFLMLLDRLFRRALAGELEDRLEAVYVSPLRALSHDIQRNLEVPLEEIHAEARRMGHELPRIRAAVRTGDTPQGERQAMLRRPPHILVTTPESLFLLLTAQRSREILKSARTVIVDEIHALARDKRGSHLALSLERLEALADARPARIGLSATQRPMDLIARFLVGSERARPETPRCTIVDLGHQRDLDLAIEVPQSEDLSAVASKEQWDDLLDVIAGHVNAHRTTLIFTNTRRLAERLAHLLGEKVGAEHVAAHHGSLARERRLKVEQRLKDGDLRALVATASLELGIDIGSVELVCQIGSPRSIATLLQRIGRSGHALGLRPCGRLFPTTRDELVECAALVRAVRAGRLDRICPSEAPLDILAQQIVAVCACGEQGEDELFELVRRAYPYRGLERRDYDALLEMLSRGIETPKGRRGAYVYRDRVERRLRPRRGARMAAILSGGAIPETGDYRVVLDPEETVIGTVNEDWAIESMAGDVFLLGTHSWRIRRVESAVVRVVDAQGAPPTIPFWLGEAPARTLELSGEVSELRRELALRVESDGAQAGARWLQDECGLSPEGALQVARYVHVQVASIGRVPTCEDLVAERFFDEAGGMQLVVHSPWGARINRGFALALRKRFCQSFDMELQAAATDDAMVLSLGNPQTFPLESIVRFLSPGTVRDVLAQAFLASPLFAARWRWNATRSLAVPRARSKGRVPFPIQRMQADDLLAAVFPEQTACQENVAYPVAIPDHPLVAQTMHDCMTEAADIDGLVGLLERIEAGLVRVHCLDTIEPSPFTHEILNARPYAFLDDAPLEERRTRAVALRHVLPDDAQDLARLDPEAIARVREEARPLVRDPDELCDLLVDLVVARESELEADELAAELVRSGRAARVAGDGGERLFAVERLGLVRALFPHADVEPPVSLPEHIGVEEVEPEPALAEAVRGHLALLGPTDARELAARIGAPELRVEAGLARLEGTGIAVRGRFEPDARGEQFCDRSLLARIHRYTLVRLRKEIEPVSAGDFLSFLLHWQHVHRDAWLYGESGLLRVVEQLSGFEAAMAAWEPGLLASRVGGYTSGLLDALCLSGSVAWGRLSTRPLESGAQPSRATPIALFARDEMEHMLHGVGEPVGAELRGPGERILELLRGRGALFARELGPATGLLPVQVDEGLKELAARGLVTCDGFAPLRRLLGERPRGARRRRAGRMLASSPPGPEGRWGLLRPSTPPPELEERAERSAWRLLRRYGVVFRDVLAREWVPEGWREVHRALRTLEARGLVRGGRFVSGFTGEQFALPEAVPLLRKQRGRERSGEEVRVSACDPLNLAGILTPGPRVPAGHARWVVYRDGIPVAAIERGQRLELDSGARVQGRVRDGHAVAH